MASLKTIAATAVIAVAGTVAAFTGPHLGQSPAAAATVGQQAKAKASYTLTLTSKDLARLSSMMRDQQTKTAVPAAAHHEAHQGQQAAHRATHAATSSASRACSRGATAQRCATHPRSRCSRGDDPSSGHRGGGCRSDQQGGGCD
jgi:Flp pilus assembly protein CpaB